MTLPDWNTKVDANLIDNVKRRITPEILRMLFKDLAQTVFTSITTGQVFPTVAALRLATNLRTDIMYWTKGGLAEDDGNGHSYTWKASRTGTDDGVNVVFPSTGQFSIYQ